MFGPKADDLQLEHQLKLLAGTLVYEFLAETVPQLAIQGLNNTARDSWSVFPTLSFTISLGVGVDTLYKMGVNVLYKGYYKGDSDYYFGRVAPVCHHVPLCTLLRRRWCIPDASLLLLLLSCARVFSDLPKPWGCLMTSGTCSKSASKKPRARQEAARAPAKLPQARPASRGVAAKQVGTNTHRVRENLP